jgi:SEC-C motif
MVRFSSSEIYKNTKTKNKISYHWDELIQRTCQNHLDGTLGGNGNLGRGQSAICEMAKEPRFIRRSLSEKMLSAVAQFPTEGEWSRQITFLPSFTANVGYVFLQLRAPESCRAEPEYGSKRRAILEIACAAAKNYFPKLSKVIGIGIDAPKFSEGNSGEDFILMPCEDWPEDRKTYYKEQNKEFKFFETSSLRRHYDRLTQFVVPAKTKGRQGKVGRNALCHCGSKKKFKKCHGFIS